MTHYFINRKTGANKFWSAECKHKTLLISFGRLGTAGRQLKKEFATDTACKAEWQKLIKEKIKKGYTATKKVPHTTAEAVGSFSPMNRQVFWKLINTSLQYTNLEKQANYLKRALKGLAKKDLVAFYNIFNRLENNCYTWKLWAAAYTIHAGCSDDGFADFRGWLITRGQAVYEKAVASPDSLAVLGRKKLEQSYDGEYMLYLASTVYEELYNTDISNDGYVQSYKVKTAPSGREWDEGDSTVLQKINPLLFALFKNKWQHLKATRY